LSGRSPKLDDPLSGELLKGFPATHILEVPVRRPQVKPMAHASRKLSTGNLRLRLQRSRNLKECLGAEFPSSDLQFLRLARQTHGVQQKRCGTVVIQLFEASRACGAGFPA
jgi:hypothetical protein